MIGDNFTEIHFTRDNIDRYIVRTSLLNAIKSNLHNLSGGLLDIGCGKMPYRELILKNSRVTKYTGLDIETALNYDDQVRPDYTWNGVTMPFGDQQFDCALATEVLEHCPDPELVLKETARVLKPGGALLFTVPFLWPLHEVPHDEYRYTPFSIKRHLENSGFENVNISATGGWHASLAQLLGLWAKRSPMSKRKKKFFSFLLTPVIKKLLAADKDHVVNFKESQMITGLYGTATKRSLEGFTSQTELK
jgi:ubiquinone/menaquinone biosynthesis C-methylase UbiE